jgi:hypothetical protein
MPPRNPLLIVKEYLEPGEPPQVRKNALTALAALGGPESLAILVESALNDEDAQVRERAEAEIASLPASEVAQALQPVLDALKESNRQRDAYALLGRLRNRGVSFRFPGLGIWTRLRLAKWVRISAYPKRGFRFHFRTLKGMSAGMLLAVSALLFYLGWMLDVSLSQDFIGGVLGVYIVVWVLALPVVMIATAFTSPPRYHADITFAALLDMLMAALSSVVFATLLILAWIADQKENPSVRGAPTVVLCTVPLAAAAVRGGTLAAFGIFRQKWTNYLTQIVAGGLCGTAVYELAAIAYGKTGNYALSLGWMWTLVAGFGLAGGYAAIDKEARPRPIVSRGARIPAGILAAVALCIGLAALVRPPEPKINTQQITQFPRTFALLNVPATIAFETELPCCEAAVDDNRYTVKLDPDPQIPNRFSLRIARNTDIKSAELWDLIPQLTKLLSWPQLKARILRTQVAGGPVAVNVTLDRQKAKSAGN